MNTSVTYSDHLSSRAPDIARHVVGIWRDHTQALDRHCLPYVDRLIEELLREEPICASLLQDRLINLVPKLTPGTARRLIDLKFGAGSPTRLLSVA